MRIITILSSSLFLLFMLNSLAIKAVIELVKTNAEQFSKLTLDCEKYVQETDFTSSKKQIPPSIFPELHRNEALFFAKIKMTSKSNPEIYVTFKKQNDVTEIFEFKNMLPIEKIFWYRLPIVCTIYTPKSKKRKAVPVKLDSQITIFDENNVHFIKSKL